MSPGQAFFGRAIRGRLPTLSTGWIVNRNEQIHWDIQMANEHDRKRGVRGLPVSESGRQVVFQD